MDHEEAAVPVDRGEASDGEDLSDDEEDALLIKLGHCPDEKQALNSCHNILPDLEERRTLLEFRQNQLVARQPQILDLAARHLGVPASDLIMFPPEDWLCGSFNICIQIYMFEKHHSRLFPAVMFRVALPFGVGEGFCPGTVEEKIRSEAANYAWLEKFSPTVPIPRLVGIGFPGSQSVRRAGQAV